MRSVSHILIFLALSLSSSLLSTPAMARVTCEEIFVKNLGNLSHWGQDTQMLIYRFYGEQTNSSANVALYHMKRGAFESYFKGTLSVQQPNAKGQSLLLENLQNFSTQVMYERGVISREVRDRQAPFLDSYSPSQVTFIEIARPVEIKDVEANPKDYPDHLLTPVPIQQTHPGKRLVREAGMWVLSGQYQYRQGAQNKMDFHSSDSSIQPIPWHREGMRETPRDIDPNHPYLIQFAIHPLPWQTNKELIEKGQLPIRVRDRTIDLDRQRFPIAFEIGRAAQVRPERFAEMMKISSSIMVEETLGTMAGRLSDAYVFANVGNPKLLPRFKEQGFKELEGACLRPNLCVLYISLAKFIERYPPGENSYPIKRLQEMAPKMDYKDALLTLQNNQISYRNELDFVALPYGIAQESPIVIHNNTKLNYILRLMLAKVARLESEAKETEFTNYLKFIRQDIFDRNRDLYDHDIPFDSVKDNYEKENLVRISNLDPKYADNPNYIPLLLMGVDQYFVDTIRQYPMQQSAEKIMQASEINYAIQTMDPAMAANARKWLGESELQTAGGPTGRIYTFLASRQAVRQMKEEAGLTDREAAVLQKGHRFGEMIYRIPWKY